MKIINRKEFLLLPSGTVFFDYRPHNGPLLSVKTCGPSHNINDDFCRQDIDALGVAHDSSEELMTLMDSMVDNGVELPLVFDNAGRDGMFDRDALFAVLDDVDVKRLVVAGLGVEGDARVSGGVAQNQRQRRRD